MSREWKPGDVAAIPFGDGNERGMWVDDHWVVTGGRSWVAGYSVRPLVVIDPEDRAQVERLLESLRGPNFSVHACGAFTCLQAALREFADPTPVKPPEPTGLGAVVEDAEGERWLRDWKGYWRKSDVTAKWSALSAVRVLSEGVPS